MRHHHDHERRRRGKRARCMVPTWLTRDKCSSAESLRVLRRRCQVVNDLFFLNESNEGDYQNVDDTPQNILYLKQMRSFVDQGETLKAMDVVWSSQFGRGWWKRDRYL